MEDRNKFLLVTEKNSSVNVCSKKMHWDSGCDNEHEQEETYML